MTSTTRPHTGSALRALDPDLPMLASQAAIELDNIRLGIPDETSAADRLSGLLENSMETGPNAAERRARIDSITVTLIERALNDSYQTEPKTLDELLEKACEIASDLKSPQNTGIEQVRAFCVALSRCASYYQSTNRVRASHPFRR